MVGSPAPTPAPTPWTPAAAFGSSLITWLDRNDSASITTATGISAWADKSGRTGRSFVQATGANQPVLTATEGQWDGTNDMLDEGDVTFTYNNDQLVPDGRGGRGAGLGFSLTHIAPDPVTGGFVLANDGRATDPTGAGSCLPSLMFVAADIVTKVREVNLSDGRSVQGVAFDPADSAFVWCARPATSGGAAGSLDRVNATSGAVGTTLALDVNGMTIVPNDPLGESLYFIVTLSSSLGTLRFLRSDGTEIRNAVTGISGGVDGLWWDAANQWLWVQTNATTYIYSIHGRRLATIATGATFNRGEAICRVGTKVYITHNGSYHASGTPAAVPDTSRVFVYDVTNLSAVGRDGAHYALFWLGNHGGAAPTANRVLIGHQNPLSGQGLSLFSTNSPAVGMASYTNTGATGTTEQGLANYTVAVGTRSVWSLIIDAVAETASLYRDSVLVATVAIANIASGRVVAGRQTLGASIESGAPARWSRLRLTQMFEYCGEVALTTAQRQKAEAYLARNDPAGTALAAIDASNPYKTGELVV